MAIVFDLDIPFYSSTKEEAKKTARVLNIDLEFFAPKNRMTSAEEMNKVLDYILENKFDGIIISPISDEKITEKLRTAREKGMKIAFLNSVVPEIPYETFILTDNLVLGETGAKSAVDIMGKEGKILVLEWSDVIIQAIKEREEGFLKEIRNHSGIIAKKIPVPSSPSPSDAEKLLDKIFAAEPEVKLVFTTNGDWGVLLADYLKKRKSSIKIVTIDFTREMVEYIKNEEIHVAIAQRNFLWGTLAMESLIKTMSGKVVEKYNDTGAFEVKAANVFLHESKV